MDTSECSIVWHETLIECPISCPIDVRYLFGNLPDIYRTSNDQITDKSMRGIWGTIVEAMRGV
jgi:hypothetical protein